MTSGVESMYYIYSGAQRMFSCTFKTFKYFLFCMLKSIFWAMSVSLHTHYNILMFAKLAVKSNVGNYVKYFSNKQVM